MAQLTETSSNASPSETSSSDLRQGRLSPLNFGLMSLGGIGAVLFTAVYLILGITRPGYDAWQQPISALSLGPGGWVERANFIIFGVLLVLAAVGWWRFLEPRKGAFWFPLLQTIGGLALIGAGIFSMDPFPGYPPGTTPGASTLHGTLHTILAYIVITSLAISCYALAARFWNMAHWRGWATYSLIAGIIMQILWGVFVSSPISPVAGLVERLAAGGHDIWMCVILVLLFVQMRRKPISL